MVLELATPLEADPASGDIPLRISCSRAQGGRSPSADSASRATGDDPGVTGLNPSTIELFSKAERKPEDERWLTTVARVLTKDPARAQETQRTHQKVDQIRTGRISS